MNLIPFIFTILITQDAPTINPEIQAAMDNQVKARVDVINSTTDEIRKGIKQ